MTASEEAIIRHPGSLLRAGTGVRKDERELLIRDSGFCRNDEDADREDI